MWAVNNQPINISILVPHTGFDSCCYGDGSPWS